MSPISPYIFPICASKSSKSVLALPPFRYRTPKYDRLLVPRPRANLTRYHGVFAPNSAHRALVAKVGRGKGRACAALSSARTGRGDRMRRVFILRILSTFSVGRSKMFGNCVAMEERLASAVVI